jgi:hypothetical protein
MRVLEKTKPEDHSLSWRQRIVLAVYLLTACILSVLLLTHQFSERQANSIIFFFGIMWPLLLLAAFFQDLRNPRYFRIWFVIAIIQLVITLITFRNPAFIIAPNNESVSFMVSENEFVLASTESLKSLIFFLMAYQILRKVYLRFTGLELTNTYALSTWYNPRDERRITTLDVLMNLSLYLVIIIGNFLPLRLFV